MEWNKGGAPSPRNSQWMIIRNIDGRTDGWMLDSHLHPSKEALKPILFFLPSFPSIRGLCELTSPSPPPPLSLPPPFPFPLSGRGRQGSLRSMVIFRYIQREGECRDGGVCGLPPVQFNLSIHPSPPLDRSTCSLTIRHRIRSTDRSSSSTGASPFILPVGCLPQA